MEHTTLTEEEVEAKCLADFNSIVTKVVLAQEVECYRDSEHVTIFCDPPAPVRISRLSDHSIKNLVTRWMDHDVCDPVYEITLLDKDDARFAGVHPSWIYGTSHYKSGRTDEARFIVAPDNIQERYKVDLEDSVDTSWIDVSSGFRI